MKKQNRKKLTFQRESIRVLQSGLDVVGAGPGFKPREIAATNTRTECGSFDNQGGLCFTQIK